MTRVLPLDGGLGWSFWDRMYGNLDRMDGLGRLCIM
jgi:hypothetical protein